MGSDNIVLRALSGDLAVPNFREFCVTLKQLYTETLAEKSGYTLLLLLHHSCCHDEMLIRRDGRTLASYIPILKQADPERFAFSVCTVGTTLNRSERQQFRR